MSEHYTLFGIELNLAWVQVVVLVFILIKLHEMAKNQRLIISAIESRKQANKGTGEY